MALILHKIEDGENFILNGGLLAPATFGDYVHTQEHSHI
jgi:hypothetical protein